MSLPLPAIEFALHLDAVVADVGTAFELAGRCRVTDWPKRAFELVVVPIERFLVGSPQLPLFPGGDFLLHKKSEGSPGSFADIVGYLPATAHEFAVSVCHHQPRVAN